MQWGSVQAIYKGRPHSVLKGAPHKQQSLAHRTEQKQVIITLLLSDWEHHNSFRKRKVKQLKRKDNCSDDRFFWLSTTTIDSAAGAVSQKRVRLPLNWRAGLTETLSYHNGSTLHFSLQLWWSVSTSKQEIMTDHFSFMSSWVNLNWDPRPRVLS